MTMLCCAIAILGWKERSHFVTYSKKAIAGLASGIDEGRSRHLPAAKNVK
ncbi:MAG: hypothetical protein JGK24_24415 [Microcoleus sp. PH2017_29_MFU_D_A]|nr:MULTISPECIES: hypothetical protein [unclassified Microcoleus]MCC3574999.1 hypothetical protein [Microcoleus sp. PH2017_34_RAT_O_A]MCC3588386.1 hypothetical protein [Microcoleus sp. PH2017_30_WIL_O_A]MCC3594873.1 hypothetical protein [Microcoleus sp. PH2017_28_MFU_U_A]MCC3606282.1 hypothetical protein [Microcoleus sp. PH2017_29_MFU_D_A]MCC3612608.1 hypothetical protein [Microcoleus sp. PH2017_40_RAT_O_B]